MSINNEYAFSQIGIQRSREFMAQADEDRLASLVPRQRPPWWRRLVQRRASEAPVRRNSQAASTTGYSLPGSNA